MGKRSDFERVPRDYYPTPLAAVEPLISHLPYSFDYVEPCAGDGRLIDHLDKLTDSHGECLFASDIEPRGSYIATCNALEIDITDMGIDFCITNPPWERKILHPFIDTKQSAILMTYCVKVVSVGRVKWIENSKSSGKDNCAWYLFDFMKVSGKPTEFYGRTI